MLTKIKQLCKSQGISISKLESDLRFGNKAIYRWEKITPGIDKVKAVADYFNVSVDYLLQKSTAELVEGLMKMNDLSAEDLKEKSTIDYKAIISGAKEPTDKELSEIASFFGVDVEYFTGIQAPPKEQNLRILEYYSDLNDEGKEVAELLIRSLMEKYRK